MLVAEEKRLNQSSFVKFLQIDAFHKSLIACCVEVVLFSYNIKDKAEFTTLLQVFAIPAFEFGKIIESFVTSAEMIVWNSFRVWLLLSFHPFARDILEALKSAYLIVLFGKRIHYFMNCWARMKWHFQQPRKHQHLGPFKCLVHPCDHNRRIRLCQIPQQQLQHHDPLR